MWVSGTANLGLRLREAPLTVEGLLSSKSGGTASLTLGFTSKDDSTTTFIATEHVMNHPIRSGTLKHSRPHSMILSLIRQVPAQDLKEEHFSATSSFHVEPQYQRPSTLL